MGNSMQEVKSLSEPYRAGLYAFRKTTTVPYNWAVCIVRYRVPCTLCGRPSGGFEFKLLTSDDVVWIPCNYAKDLEWVFLSIPETIADSTVEFP